MSVDVAGSPAITGHSVFGVIRIAFTRGTSRAMNSLPGGAAPGDAPLPGGAAPPDDAPLPDVPLPPADAPLSDAFAPPTGLPQLMHVFASSASVWPQLEQNIVDILLTNARQPADYRILTGAGQCAARMGSRAMARDAIVLSTDQEAAPPVVVLDPGEPASRCRPARERALASCTASSQ